MRDLKSIDDDNKAYVEGVKAAKDGKPITTNPYALPYRTHQCWNNGYMDTLEKNV